MEIRKQEKEASLRVLMKASLEGYSWAENIYQRVETICAESNIVQNPEKYVDVVGEHLRKVIDTVVNHADAVLELFSELSFGHASLVKASGKSGEELDGDSLHDKPSACVCEETAFMENLSLEHDTVPRVMDEAFCINSSLSEHENGAMAHERSIVEIEENASVEKYACVSLAPEENSSMIHQSIQTGGSSTFNSIYILDIESKDLSHVLESNGSELAPRNGPEGRENPTNYENLNSFSVEELGSSIFSLKNEDLSEFEDVKLEDDFKTVKDENDWDDIVNTEIALISSLAAKKESSKTKLKKMFISRWRPSSRKWKPSSLRDDLNLKAPSDSDWELL